MKIAIQRMPHCEDLPLPAYATAGAAGLDLLAAVDAAKPLRLEGQTFPAQLPLCRPFQTPL